MRITDKLIPATDWFFPKVKLTLPIALLTHLKHKHVSLEIVFVYLCLCIFYCICICKSNSINCSSDSPETTNMYF